MIRRIVLHNFMAHEDTAITLVDGVNVVVGPNNIGKSTIALALKLLARNSNSSFVLQHEKSECSVTVETDDGHTIQWLRRKSPSYIIDGDVKDRLGRGGTPPELLDTLRLAPVEFEDRDFEPHFGDQKSPIFLINRSPSQVAQFFSTTSDVERLVAMQRLHQRNRSSAQSELARLDKSAQELNEDKSLLAEVPKIADLLGVLERESYAIQIQSQQIAQLDAGLAMWAATLHELADATCACQALQSLVGRPELHDTQSLTRWMDGVDDTSRDQAEYSETSTCLASLSTLPTMVSTEGIEGCLRDYAVALSQQLIADTQHASLGHLTEPPAMIDCDPLADQIRAFTEIQRLFEEMAQSLDDYQRAGETLDREASAWIAMHPTCPTCAAPLSLTSVQRHVRNH